MAKSKSKVFERPVKINFSKSYGAMWQISLEYADGSTSEKLIVKARGSQWELQEKIVPEGKPSVTGFAFPSPIHYSEECDNPLQLLHDECRNNQLRLREKDASIKVLENIISKAIAANKGHSCDNEKSTY